MSCRARRHCVVSDASILNQSRAYIRYYKIETHPSQRAALQKLLLVKQGQKTIHRNTKYFAESRRRSTNDLLFLCLADAVRGIRNEEKKEDNP